MQRRNPVFINHRRGMVNIGLMGDYEMKFRDPIGYLMYALVPASGLWVATPDAKITFQKELAIRHGEGKHRTSRSERYERMQKIG